MRGKVAAVCWPVSALGITPACAGKRARCWSPARRGWDHPRVCGEKLFASALTTACQGSPPRVRGKVAAFCADRVGDRITPACAGKRAGDTESGRKAGDHPRVCGEKFSYEWGSRGRKGSPPRVRGKACCMTQRQRRIRITPACAGKSISTLFPACDGQDHPRVCGEKLQIM